MDTTKKVHYNNQDIDESLDLFEQHYHGMKNMGAGTFEHIMGYLWVRTFAEILNSSGRTTLQTLRNLLPMNWLKSF